MSSTSPQVLWSDASPPVPSPADAGYLSLPPLIILGVVLLTRARVREANRMVFVDGLIAGLAVGAMSAAIVFKPVLDSLHGLSISVITNFAYPVLDLIMLGRPDRAARDRRTPSGPTASRPGPRCALLLGLRHDLPDQGRRWHLGLGRAV